MNVTISKYTSPRDNTPLREEMTWADFVALFSEPIVALCTLANCQRSACMHKCGPAWSPAAFVNGYRSGAVVALSLLVFDVDLVTDDEIYEIRKQIGSYRHLMHSTHSDRPDSRCVRIIITLSRPVPHEMWGAFWQVAKQTLVPIADVSCSDASRIYFLPSVPHDAGYFVQVNEGESLDVEAMIATGRRLTVPAVEGTVTR